MCSSQYGFVTATNYFVCLKCFFVVSFLSLKTGDTKLVNI